MNVQPIRLEVHGLHAIRLEDAVLLGEIGLCERLSHAEFVSQMYIHVHA